MKKATLRKIVVFGIAAALTFTCAGNVAVAQETNTDNTEGRVKAPIPKLKVLENLFASDEEEVEESTGEIETEEADEGYVDEEIDENVITVKEKPVNFRIGHGSVVLTIKNDNKTVSKARIVDAEAAVQAILTPEQMESVRAGSKAQINLRTIPLYQSGVSRDDLALIEEAVSDLRNTVPNIKKGNYIDVSVQVKMNHDNWVDVKELQAPIKLTLIIPEYYRGLAQDYYTICLHNNETEIHEDLDKRSDTITINADSLAVYTIIFDEQEQKATTAVVNAKDHKISLFANDNLGWFIAAGILMAAMIRERFKALYNKKRR